MSRLTRSKRGGHQCRLLLGVMVWVLLAALPATADVVWEVRGEGRFLLGGTMHLLRPGDFPLPPEFERAYQASDQLVLETDPADLATPEVQQLLQTRGFMAPGTSVQGELQADTWQRVEGFALARDLDLAFLQQLQPALLAITLTNIELARLGVTEMGVDGYFYQRARADGLQLEQLETAADQVGMVLALGEHDPDGYVLASLRELERAPALLDDGIGAWRDGNYERLFQTMVTPLKEDHPHSYQVLFVDRHQAWMPVLKDWAGSPETRLVLVGAGHLGGPDGLLRMLDEAGLEVRPWQP